MIVAPPEGQLYHGIFPAASEPSREPNSEENLIAYERAVGRKLAWVYISHEWWQSPEFPMTTVNWVRHHGAAPFIRLMLRSSYEQFTCEHRYTLDAIIAGDFDSQLLAWGQAAADIPLICEYGTEANGMWFPWNAVHNGAEKGPEKFKQAFKRIVSKIREGGGNNITWVFHVNHNDNPDISWNQLEKYDPGLEFSDWLGVSLYGAMFPSDSEWPTFSETMDKVYTRLERLPGNRPIMICEFGFTENGSGGRDAVHWADDALSSLLAGRWPMVRGFSWWNERWSNISQAPTEMRVQCVPGLGALFRDKIELHPNVVDRPIHQ